MQGPEHDAFIEAAKAEADTEFVLTTVPEVAQMFINPSLIAVSKQEPERFSAFGMDLQGVPSFPCMKVPDYVGCRYLYDEE